MLWCAPSSCARCSEPPWPDRSSCWLHVILTAVLRYDWAAGLKSRWWRWRGSTEHHKGQESVKTETFLRKTLLMLLSSSQSSFPGCLRTAARRSRSSSRRSSDVSLLVAPPPPVGPGGSEMSRCCVSGETRCVPGHAPPPSHRSHPDTRESSERYEPAWRQDSYWWIKVDFIFITFLC